jgi:hypothetical protein
LETKTRYTRFVVAQIIAASSRLIAVHRNMPKVPAHGCVSGLPFNFRVQRDQCFAQIVARYAGQFFHSASLFPFEASSCCRVADKHLAGFC